MTICVQWPRFGPYHVARLTALASRATERGWELVAIETASDDSTYSWDVESREPAFKRVQVLPGAVYERVPANEMQRAVVRMLDRIDPGAVAITSYSTPDARAALCWCRRNKRVAVLMTDSRRADAVRSGPREWVKSQLASQYDSALVAGQEHSQYLEGLGFDPKYVFDGYDVVDNDYFTSTIVTGTETLNVEAEIVANKTPYFLASNRFVTRKNVGGLLRAYGSYRRNTVVDPWRLVLLGDGPLRASLEDQARSDGIDGVEFVGFRQYADLPGWYAQASAFVHVPLADQWGLVINEAMASGLPIIASRSAGATIDLVKQGANGFVVDADDYAGIAQALTVVSTAPESLRAEMGRQSRLMIANWSVDRFSENLIRAVERGKERSNRGLDLVPRLILAALSVLARRAKSFHIIAE